MNCIALILLCISCFEFVQFAAAIKLLLIQLHSRKYFSVKTTNAYIFSTVHRKLNFCQPLALPLNLDRQSDTCSLNVINFCLCILFVFSMSYNDSSVSALAPSIVFFDGNASYMVLYEMTSMITRIKIYEWHSSKLNVIRYCIPD